MEWEKKQAAYIRRKKLQERAFSFLGDKCTICGYNKCSAALEFHHPYPQEKSFSISTSLTSWKKILPELKKCILLCANCHREVHNGMHPGYLILEGAWIPFEHEFYESITESISEK